MSEFDAPQSRVEALLQNLLGADNPYGAPQSRIEAILQNMLGANNVLLPPESRNEELLLEILQQGGGGGKPTQTKTATPTEQEQSITPDEGYLLSEVTVNPIPSQYIVPTGKKTITANATDIDVAQYATADVAVPTADLGTKSITANGTYAASADNLDGYSSVTVDVSNLPSKGFVFNNYDADGYPHTAEFVGNWSIIPKYFFCLFIENQSAHDNNSFIKEITHLQIPHGVTTIQNGTFWRWNIVSLDIGDTVVTMEDSFKQCSKLRNVTIRCGAATRWFYVFQNVSLQTLTFTDNVPSLLSLLNASSPTLELVDFSHNTQICALTYVNSFPHADGCVIRIPYAYSDEYLGDGNGWQSATNWVNFPTDPNESGYVVWEVVGNA